MTTQRFIDVVKRRSLVVWSVIAIGLALIYSFRNAVPSSFSGVSHVVLVAENGSRDPSVGIIDLPSIATSSVVLERVRNSLKLPIPLIALKGNVSASVLGRSAIMAIGYRDQSAERAMAVSNAVADQLARYYDEISTKRYDTNVDRLSSELVQVSAKMDGLDRQMSDVLASDPFVVSDRAIDNITSDIATLTVQRGQAAAQLKADEALAATTAPSEGLSATAQHEILAGDPTYLAMRNTVAKDQAELASDRAGYTSSFPGLPGAVAKVTTEQDLTNQVAARALTDPNAYSASAAATKLEHTHQLAVITGDQARLAQLDAVIRGQQTALSDIPTTGNRYDQLRAERDAVAAEYTTLATRRANALANRAEASSLGSVVVLDRAIKADTQLASGRTRAGVLSLILVLAAALGSAFLVESLDPRIRRPEEVEELYGIPVVAHVGARR